MAKNKGVFTVLRDDFGRQAGADIPFGENRKRIDIVAFLSPFRGCSSYTEQTRLASEENATRIPPQFGMGTAGYRILTVYEDEWLEFGKRLVSLETRETLQILAESPRCLYRSMIGPTSYMNPCLQPGDMIVDDDGKNHETIAGPVMTVTVAAKPI